MTKTIIVTLEAGFGGTLRAFRANISPSLTELGGCTTYRKGKKTFMAKLGTEKKPVRFRAQTEERLGEIAAICEDNGWRFVGGLEPDEPEDISEVEYLLNPTAFESQPRMGGGETVVRNEPKVGRNEPCPCGSGKKYKKCCMS